MLKRFVYTSFICVLLNAPCAIAKLSEEQKLYGLSALWKEASYNFAYFDQVPKLDWDKHYQAYISKVLATQTDYQYYRALSQFLAQLNDGMTYVEIPETMVGKQVAFPPVKLAEAGKKAVVVGVAQGLKERLPLGSEITHINGQAVNAYLANEVFPFVSSSTEHIRWHEAIRGNRRLGYGLLAGVADSTLAVNFVTPGGDRGQIKLQRQADLSQIDWQLANGVIDDKPSIQFERLADDVSYIALNDFSSMQVSERFKALIPQLQSTSGLILDLRHNRGGNTIVAEEIIKHLTFHDLMGTRAKMRIHNSTYKAWGKYSSQYEWAKKYAPYFDGTAWLESEPDIIYASEIQDAEKVVIPTVVLISRETSAAAESFLVYASSAKHIKLIGEPTFGSTGQPLEVELPGGGKAMICTKRETFSDGRDFVGFGIQPDVYIERDVAFYLSEQDKTLIEAKRLFQDQAFSQQMLMAQASR